jgi:thioredoxin reductase
MRETPSSATAVPAAALPARRPAAFAGRSVVVAADGGGLDEALALLPFAREVTLVHGADGGGGAVRAAAAVQLLRLVEGAVAGVEHEGGRLRVVHVATARGPLRLAADELLTPADIVPFEE